NLPGVESASAVMCPPLEGIRWTSPYLSDNHDTTPPSQRPQTVLNMTEPSYFETMKIRLVEGRYFTAHDGSSSPLVVIINQALANRVWPGRSAIGRQLYVQENWREVVGVVGGTKQFGLEFRTMPEAFLPDAQLPVNFMTVVVRTSTDPRNMVKTLADTIQSVDGAQSVPAPYPVTEKLSEVLARRGFLTLLLASFGILGLALAAVGVFGVASYQVARQTQEIGVRMALGARRSSVVWLVLRKGLLRGFGGVVVGLAGALATTRLLSTVLFGVKPIDPVTFAGVVIVVLAVTAAACWIPALRASRVDPVLSLRRE
ncbi:MAG TPA: FtsX-like permease family protein, partial [Blastocatellia bacterium]|nr:FtsX-like permease family protein [Blastocatellia bacterium]